MTNNVDDKNIERFLTTENLGTVWEKIMSTLDGQLKLLYESIQTRYSELSYKQLLTLKTNNQLLPGIKYRIIDYITTTAQSNTKSVGYSFDIIVEAISKNELSENAIACLRAGDEKFVKNNITSWELKYCIDNDTSRFAWADTENGKGVIYWMKDENCNEAPYDFKNIQFINKNEYYFTFSTNNYNNTIKPYHNENNVQVLNNIILGENSSNNTFSTNCHTIKLGNHNNNNTFLSNCNNIKISSKNNGECLDYVRNFYFGYNCHDLNLYNSSISTGENNYLQNFKIHNDITSQSGIALEKHDNFTNRNYTTEIGYNINNILIQYVIGVVNNSNLTDIEYIIDKDTIQFKSNNVNVENINDEYCLVFDRTSEANIVDDTLLF